jgi:hypothetical protein
VKVVSFEVVIVLELQEELVKYEIIKNDVGSKRKEKNSKLKEIFEMGKDGLRKALKNTVWGMKFFDGSLIRLQLKEGDAFKKIFNQVKKIGIDRVDLQFDNYEFEFYNDGYSIRVLDTFERNNGGNLSGIVRGKKLLKVLNQYFNLDMDDVKERLAKYIANIEKRVKPLLNEIDEVQNMLNELKVE